MQIQESRHGRLLWWLLATALFALCFRLLYQTGVVSIRDSTGDLSGALQAGRVSLYFYFQNAIFALFDTQSLRVVVTIQAIIDSATVIAIGLAAMALAPELVLPAAITAAIIPNFLVHASSDLPETLFIAFFSWSLCALLWAIRGRNAIALLVLSGLLLGFALLCRVALLYFPLILVPVLAYALHVRHGAWLRSLALACIPPIVMLLVSSPLFIYNLMTFGFAELSSQAGPHLLYWVYGCLATPWPCAERARIVTELAPIVAERIQSSGIDSTNQFAVSAIQRDLAIERILNLPALQIAWGMTWGAFKNLMQTGFYQVFTQYDQPATFLSAMPGETFMLRFRNFVFVNKDNYFMMMWAASQLCLVLSRAVQLYGIVIGISNRQYRGITCVLLATVLYFLLLNGPIADPKYRMPMEPALIILFALGITALIGKTVMRLDGRKPALT